MDIFKTDIFKFVSGDMLADQKVWMTIRAVELEKLSGPNGESEKPLVYFQGTKKPLILNATNAKKLAKSLGRETTAWHGAKVELYAEEVKAFGKLHNSVRIGKIEKPAQLTKEQRNQRRAENTDLLHGPQDDAGIGDDMPPIAPAQEVINPVDLYAHGRETGAPEMDPEMDPA